MASVTWLGFTSLVSSAVAAVQAAANAVIDAAVGSVTLAYAQAQAGAALFLQGQAAQVTALSRLATSYGNDVDTFVNTFGMSRLPSTYATSTETFARFTPAQSALILAGTMVGGNPATLTGGAIVTTGPGGVQFMVTKDTTNALWNQAQGGYLLPANTASATVPIQCLTPGVAGNVLAGTITSFFSPIGGIDTCTNAAAVTNGVAQEIDSAVKTRFPIYLDGLASADYAAIVSAITGVQQGLFYLPVENFDYPGTEADDGSFFVVIDDGSHDPPASLITAVYNAVYAIRGFSIRCQGVYGVTATTISLGGTITSAEGYVHGNVVQAVDAAWANWINAYWQNWLKSLVPGQAIVPPTIAVAAVAAVAMNVPGVSNIALSSITINGVNADLTLTMVQAPTPGTIAAA